MKRFVILTMIYILSRSVSAQNWIIEPIDSIDYMFDCSIAMDIQNNPQLAYCTRQRLGGNFYSYWIKYASWNGVTWEFQPVETTEALNTGIPVFKAVRLRLDNQNHSHIAYVYVKDSCQYKYAYYDGGSWQISVIDSVKNLRYYHIPRGCFDMTLSQSGIPYISYSFINWKDSIHGIRYAYKSGDSWIIQSVWEEDGIPHSYLSTTAIDVDRTGYPVIVFEYYYPAPINTGYLFCARFDGLNWVIDTVAHSSQAGYFVYSLKLDNSGRVHIFYQNDFDLFYAIECGDTWYFEWLGFNGLFESRGDMVLDGDKPKVVWSSIEDYLTYAYKIDTLWRYEIIEPNYEALYPSLAREVENGEYVCFIRGDVAYDVLCYARRVSSEIIEKAAKSELSKELCLTMHSSIVTSKILKLSCGLPKDEIIKIMLYDSSGRVMMRLKDERMKAGYYTDAINLNRLHNGIYWLVLKSGNETKTKKLVLIK